MRGDEKVTYKALNDAEAKVKQEKAFMQSQAQSSLGYQLRDKNFKIPFLDAPVGEAMLEHVKTPIPIEDVYPDLENIYSEGYSILGNFMKHVRERITRLRAAPIEDMNDLVNFPLGGAMISWEAPPLFMRGLFPGKVIATEMVYEVYSSVMVIIRAYTQRLLPADYERLSSAIKDIYIRHHSYVNHWELYARIAPAVFVQGNKKPRGPPPGFINSATRYEFHTDIKKGQLTEWLHLIEDFAQEALAVQPSLRCYSPTPIIMGPESFNEIEKIQLNLTFRQISPYPTYMRNMLYLSLAENAPVFGTLTPEQRKERFPEEFVEVKDLEAHFENRDRKLEDDTRATAFQRERESPDQPPLPVLVEVHEKRLTDMEKDPERWLTTEQLTLRKVFEDESVVEQSSFLVVPDPSLIGADVYDPETNPRIYTM